MDKQTNKWTDGRYQTYYLPATWSINIHGGTDSKLGTIMNCTDAAFKNELNMCFLLKHNFGECMVHLQQSQIGCALALPKISFRNCSALGKLKLKKLPHAGRRRHLQTSDYNLGGEHSPNSIVMQLHEQFNLVGVIDLRW